MLEGGHLCAGCLSSGASALTADAWRGGGGGDGVGMARHAKTPRVRPDGGGVSAAEMSGDVMLGQKHAVA